MLCYAMSLQSYPTLCDPIDGSPLGSPVPASTVRKHETKIALEIEAVIWEPKYSTVYL